jgi:hypothetical protein
MYGLHRLRCAWSRPNLPSLATANLVEAYPKMFAIRGWWRTVATVVALAGVGSAAPALTTIEDILYRADGTRFNGTLTITWSNFQSGDSNLIPTQGLTVNVVNGYLKVRLVPTTNASAGANYSVQYASQGKYMFTETWAVPSSSLTLRVRDVRVGSGSVIGGVAPVTSEVLISDVTGLTNELNLRPMKGSAFAPGRAAVINSAGLIDGASGNLDDCVRVDGSSGPCGGTDSSSDVVFADAESPAGTVNGVNASFTLANAPSPAASLALFRNGVLLKQGLDYVLSGNTLTFYTATLPQTGDTLIASYRYISSTTQSMSAFADSETPTGTTDGVNTNFTLAYAPAPASSLSFYRNGILMKQGLDYTVSGNIVTFLSVNIPMASDILTTYYRYSPRQ